MVAVRMPFSALAGERAPYSLNSVAVILATVLAGWRSGLIALVVGQLLLWYVVVQPYSGFVIPDPERLGAILIAVLSQALIILVVALYQREVAKGAAEREKRLSLLDDALKEIDHRSRNNYQTVVAMIDLQSRRSTDISVVSALNQIKDRIQAVANASQSLAVRSAGLDSVRLDDHLSDLVGNIEKGLSREDVVLQCDVDEVVASSAAATSISIIVNELVTNALKHAFNGERAGKVIVSGRAGNGFELTVADDGVGMAKGSKTSRDEGLGTRLVQSFAKQLGAKHQVDSSGEGTTHRLHIPHLG